MTALPSVQAAATGASDSSRLSNRANLEKAAKQFESIFVGMMLKSMRSAQDSVGSGLFESDTSKQFRDMQDSQMAKDIGGKGTLGIAKAMTEYMSRNRPDLQAPAATAAEEPGK